MGDQGTHAMAQIWRSEEDIKKSVLSIYSVGPEDQTRIDSVGRNVLTH